MPPVHRLLHITLDTTLRPDDFLKWVPSGVGALGELQAKGYAYIKVG
ncbi:hypothetical protein SAMN04488243_14318 [Thermus arciformis]|uniref:Uncharacterized protein n=1 Tax=Thermus arciformis TaxID=482827 RepID=A0A1G7KCH3_9DEIN|nr:hypothetical protein SAMN04488243_14318 [Thermus arciformis]